MGGCYGWMLIGACDPILCPIHGTKKQCHTPSPSGIKTSSGRQLGRRRRGTADSTLFGTISHGVIGCTTPRAACDALYEAPMLIECRLGLAIR